MVKQTGEKEKKVITLQLGKMLYRTGLFNLGKIYKNNRLHVLSVLEIN